MPSSLANKLAKTTTHKEWVADIGKFEFHANLQFRKALLQAKLRGINKMLKRLPDDPDFRAVMMD